MSALDRKPTICSAKHHVSFTPNSDRESRLPQKAMVCFASESRHVQCKTECLLRAIADMISLVIASTGWLLSREETLNVHRFLMG